MRITSGGGETPPVWEAALCSVMNHGFKAHITGIVTVSVVSFLYASRFCQNLIFVVVALNVASHNATQVGATKPFSYQINCLCHAQG